MPDHSETIFDEWEEKEIKKDYTKRNWATLRLKGGPEGGSERGEERLEEELVT